MFWKQKKADEAPSVETAEAAALIGSIFSPKHVGMREAPPSAAVDPQSPSAVVVASASPLPPESSGGGHSGRRWWAIWGADEGKPSSSSLSPGGGSASDAYMAASEPTAASPSSTSAPAAPSPLTPHRKDAGGAKNGSGDSSKGTLVVTDWRELPECPLAGYRLTQAGLVDEMQRPPRALPPGELRSLITEMSGIEQKAKHITDMQFAEQLGTRNTRGIVFVTNPALFLAGLYLCTVKTARLYQGAAPRHSALLAALSRLLRRWHRPEERERVARRHRRLMQATNARVCLTFLSGALLVAIAAVTRPPPDLLENAPDVQVAKQHIAYQRHSASTLKWLWFVYYHHPAYRDSAKSALLPSPPPAPARSGH